MAMPERLALALCEDGWYLRSRIIWHKANAMPESVSDRPTSAHEHVFLLTRSARYFYDADAVREEGEGYGRSARFRGDKYSNMASFDNSAELGVTRGGGANSFDGSGRNLRNVWDIPTEPYRGAHFATYPTALVERCIKAGTSARGCCAQCGAPWVRQTEAKGGILGKAWGIHADDLTQGNASAGLAINRRTETPYQRTTTGWSPSCTHNADVVPATVLDPFLGSGTTALVASRLQRDCIGIDLNTSYAAMAVDRITKDCPMFVEFESPPAEDPEEARIADLFAELE
jgi:hypothetical protein